MALSFFEKKPVFAFFYEVLNSPGRWWQYNNLLFSSGIQPTAKSNAIL
jgi:hypothetical protein